MKTLLIFIFHAVVICVPLVTESAEQLKSFNSPVLQNQLPISDKGVIWFWGWIKGAIYVNEAGAYGTQGQTSLANKPGAREEAASWTGLDDRLYLFGGYGFDSIGDSGQLNDLWKYDPSIDQWTWIKGAKITDQSGTYGTKELPDIANNPGARKQTVS